MYAVEVNDSQFHEAARKPLHTGVCTGCHYLIGLPVCVALVVFTDCESCTGPIPTNSRSVEAGERGHARGTCFITCCVEVVAVAGLLCLSWCVFDAAEFFAFP